MKTEGVKEKCQKSCKKMLMVKKNGNIFKKWKVIFDRVAFCTKGKGAFMHHYPFLLLSTLVLYTKRNPNNVELKKIVKELV